MMLGLSSPGRSVATSVLVGLSSITVACTGSNDGSLHSDGAVSDDATGQDVSTSDGEGSPFLTDLRVSASPGIDSGVAITLVPPFSSGVYDYYVRCRAGANALTVSMKASPGAQSLLEKPTRSGSTPEQTVSLSVTENQAVVAAATRGTAVTSWVRCLPHDFPPMLMIAHADRGTPSPGYYVVGAKATSRSAAYAMVLDGKGVPVWYTRDRVPIPNDLLDVDHVVTEGSPQSRLR
jgi:hypothetical protein